VVGCLVSAQKSIHQRMERWVADIKLRATIRIGELSRELEKSKGGSNPKSTLPSHGKSKRETLRAAGISTSEAHRAEKLAEHKGSHVVTSDPQTDRMMEAVLDYSRSVSDCSVDSSSGLAGLSWPTAFLPVGTEPIELARKATRSSYLPSHLLSSGRNMNLSAARKVPGATR